jgi:mRNA-degrading endonuclease toxin of MazEF toxin-antitoxin module
MRQWEIRMFPFEDEQPHPAVIVSTDERANAGLLSVNALICTTARLARPVKVHEMALDAADGLDWLTAVRCDVIYMLPKDRFGELRGLVSAPRRPAITRKIIEALRWPLY